MDSNEISREELVFLEFNGKSLGELLQNKVFIRLANLEDKNPLVQINDLIFKGTYNYTVGTNMFFKKRPNEDPIEFPFEERTPHKLEFATLQTKILNCKQMKIPSTPEQLPTDLENVTFNFKWDYKELLKKLENGTLDLQDMLVQKVHDANVEKLLQEDNATVQEPLAQKNIEKEPDEPLEEPNNTESTDDVMEVSEIKPVEEPEFKLCDDELQVAYENLLVLARTPVKRDITYEDAPCDPQFKNEYEYRSIECKILDPPLFSYIRKQVPNNEYENCVNLERCVTLGLLQLSQLHPRVLSEEEQNLIMTVENFENLDLRARYSVLLSHMEELEKQVNSNTGEQNCLKDEFDRTPEETLQIFKRLVSSLKRRIQEFYS